MTPLHLKIVVGAIGYLAAFVSQVTAYLAGLQSQGGSLSDYEGITIMLLALTSLSGALGALTALLTKSPNDPSGETP